MGSDVYALQTDREKQWQSLEMLMKKHGATRSNIKNCKKYFFDNEVTGGRLAWSDRFWLYHQPTFAGWQRLFDYELTEKLSDQDFRELNKLLCGQIADYYYCIEDQDYYFKTTFGEVFSKERMCPVRINGEDTHRRIALTENAILFILVNRMSRWLKEVDGKEQGILRFNIKYFESLLPVVDRASFRAGRDIPTQTDDGSARPDMIRAGLETIMKYSFLTPSSADEQIQRDSARQVTELLLDHANDLADLGILYDQVKKKAN